MQKVCFLVDMNAFFISCETTRHPEFKGSPAAVAGDPKKRTGIILAANYEARGYGVKTAMVLGEAQKLCPHMLLVAPDHSFYEEKSQQVMQLLSNFSPVLEQNSIDEAWLDMTGTEALFGSPVQAAEQIMLRIQEELELWCSIGISENKFLAKMASEMKKPLGITELWQANIKEKLWPLPAGFMYGVGSKTAEKLFVLGIKTIGDLAAYDKNKLIKHMGKPGIELHLHANGIDFSEICPHTVDEMKSIGRSTTLPTDTNDYANAKSILLQLSDEVGTAARASNKKCTTVQITLRYPDFTTITRQTKIIPTYLTRDISAAGIDLLKKNWSHSKPVRLIGLSISGFVLNNDENHQISMFQDTTSNSSSEKEERLEKAIDIIRKKHGNSKLNRGAHL